MHSVRRIMHHCPNQLESSQIASRLQVGDVILVFEVAATVSPVRTYQRKLGTFSEVANSFGHVALYIGYMLWRLLKTQC